MNWERPYAVQFDGRKIWLETAVSFDPDAQIPHLIQWQDQRVQVQFSPGVLTALPVKRP